MRLRLTTCLIAATLATPLAVARAQAGSTPPPCSTSPQPAPCTTAPAKAPDKGTATDRFPFPGETPAATPAPPDARPAAPSSAPASNPAQPADKHFPFPGETAPAAPQPNPGSSSSSSSSDPTAFPSDDTNTPDPNGSDSNSKDKAAAPEGRRLLKRVNPVGTKLQTPDQREAEDLDIAKFYIDRGNLQAAYLRTQDAVKTMPDDPAAHCSLAEAALKLNKRDEAVAEFNACLKLDPEEKEAKNARKELARLK